MVAGGIFSFASIQCNVHVAAQHFFHIDDVNSCLRVDIGRFEAAFLLSTLLGTTAVSVRPSTQDFHGITLYVLVMAHPSNFAILFQ